MNGGKWNPVLCMCEECPEPWEGDLCEHCTLDQKHCEHGGKLNIKTCQCENCDYVWTGRLCEVCPRTQKDCLHDGRLIPDLCKCIWCDDPWVGDLCEVCGREQKQCIHGTLKSESHESCRCEDGPTGELGNDANAALWEGPFLEKCRRLQRDCVHGGTINPELCKCERCSHNYWGGDLCNKCLRKNSQCKHGSTLSQQSCKCGAHHWRHLSRCPYPWTGDLCGQCPGKCYHGKNGAASFDKEECICKECAFPWEGRWCEHCSVHPLDCRHQSMLNMATCTCEGGDEPWVGHLHDTCPLTQEDCQHNSKLNEVTCDCEFCRYPWNGGAVATWAQTGQTLRVHWGAHQGKKVEYVGKASDNGVMAKVKLNGNELQIDANYLEADDADRRKDNMRGHLGGGSTCSQCNRKVGDCLHGSASIDFDTCKCVCPEPQVWTGEQCEVCGVSKYDCKYGSFFEKPLCMCKRCGENFAGSSPGKCNQCKHSDDWCKNGGTMDKKTCTCKCPTGWSGADCSEGSCPTGPNGKICSGQGTCKNVNGWAYCHCHANHAGADCSESRTSGHCHTVGDPHPYNFDNQRFDWYNDGENLLYKNVRNWEEDQMNCITTRYHSVAGNTGFAWRRRGKDGHFGHLKFLQHNSNSPCAAVFYCNNKNVCGSLGGGNCYGNTGWKEMPNGLKFRYNGGGYNVESVDGFNRVSWNSWWGPPKRRYNIYIDINEPINSAIGVCGRHNKGNPLGRGQPRWRNNLGLRSRNNGDWYTTFTPQKGHKYDSLFDSGGNCPFNVAGGSFTGNPVGSCPTYTPTSEGKPPPSPFLTAARFQELKGEEDQDASEQPTEEEKDEKNPNSDLAKCNKAKREAAVADGGICHEICAKEKLDALNQGGQCWNCLNDYCTSGDASMGATAVAADQSFQKSTADNVQKEAALQGVDSEQAKEDEVDAERAAEQQRVAQH